ncbi:hypothetical protein [Rhodococcus sp. NBC_00294]|nr:hypothetical protein [Rhodococcus sp. NBC_00294]
MNDINDSQTDRTPTESTRLTSEYVDAIINLFGPRVRGGAVDSEPKDA